MKKVVITWSNVITENKASGKLHKVHGENLNGVSVLCVVKNSLHSKKSVEADDDQIKLLIEINPYRTTCNTTKTLDFHHSTIHDHLKKLEFINMLNIYWKEIFQTLSILPKLLSNITKSTHF